jgi:hypothetical protein
MIGVTLGESIRRFARSAGFAKASAQTHTGKTWLNT